MKRTAIMPNHLNQDKQANLPADRTQIDPELQQPGQNEKDKNKDKAPKAPKDKNKDLDQDRGKHVGK